MNFIKSTVIVALLFIGNFSFINAASARVIPVTLITERILPITVNSGRGTPITVNSARGTPVTVNSGRGTPVTVITGSITPATVSTTPISLEQKPNLLTILTALIIEVKEHVDLRSLANPHLYNRLTEGLIKEIAYMLELLNSAEAAEIFTSDELKKHKERVSNILTNLKEHLNERQKV